MFSRTGGTSGYSGRAGVTDLTGVTWGLAGTPSLNLSSPRVTSRRGVTWIRDAREEEVLARFLNPPLFWAGNCSGLGLVVLFLLFFFFVSSSSCLFAYLPSFFFFFSSASSHSPSVGFYFLGVATSFFFAFFISPFRVLRFLRVFFSPFFLLPVWRVGQYFMVNGKRTGGS